MRSLRFGLMPLVLAVLLTACGGGDGGNDFPPDTYSDKDLCIVKVKGGASVCYGDSREEAEKVLGAVVERTLAYVYDSGVRIRYRDDKVVMIALDYDSRGKYKTSRGAGIRDKRSRFKALYGEKYALEWPNPSIDYYYDSDSREFLEKDEIRGLSRERAKELRVVSVQLDEDDRARTIYLGDEHALKYLS